MACLLCTASAAGGRLTVVAGPGLTSLPSPEDRCFKGSMGMPFPTHCCTLWLHCLLEIQDRLTCVSLQAVFNLRVHSDFV